MVAEQPSSRRRRRLPKPTSAPPGSEGKILVMMQRLAAGLPLHVKGDARGSDPDGETARLSLAIFRARDDEGE